MPIERRIPKFTSRDLTQILNSHLGSKLTNYDLTAYRRLMEEVASKFVDASDLAPNSKNVLKESVVLHAHASGASDLYKRGKLTPQAWADLMERVVASAEKLKDPGPDAVDFMNETRASITHIRSGGGAVIPKEGFDQVTLDLVSYVTSRRMVETMPAEEHDYANALIEELNKHLVACRQAFLTYAFRRN